ncbi:MAG: tRNA (adenosine(37)-N6)-threonylcarbamoyltransferase complex transferase subunit TsaD [bacterium]
MLQEKLSLPSEGIILGIESSCDETSAAILRGSELASVIISSQLFHNRFGGVVPELASRAHVRTIVPIVEAAFEKASCKPSDITAIAVTYAPGLMGALLVGLNFAKGLSLALQVPLIGVHHIEGHIFSALLEDDKPSLPFLALVVSGGHTMLVVVRDIGDYSVIGNTLDDAAGEAFDKVGKMMGMSYPAGPEIDNLAQSGNANFVRFPRSMINEDHFNFSFSGIKTSVLYYLRDHPGFAEQQKPDIAASFQIAVVDVLVTKTIRAAIKYGIRDIVCVGGVSANSALRSVFATDCAKHHLHFFSPRPMLSTDNAAMIAMLGALKLERGQQSTFSLQAKPRVSL